MKKMFFIALPHSLILYHIYFLLVRGKHNLILILFSESILLLSPELTEIWLFTLKLLLLRSIMTQLIKSSG